MEDKESKFELRRTTEPLKFYCMKTDYIFALHDVNDKENRQLIRVEASGDIYVNGELCTDDKLIVETLRAFAKSTLSPHHG